MRLHDHSAQDHPAAVAATEIGPKREAKSPHRSDGLEARNRLLDSALMLFGEKGFAKTSTREIALAAQVNIASISYYFGDKAGLYRAVFVDPRCNPGADASLFDSASLELEPALRAVLSGFTEPLKQGDRVRANMKLHFREMLEPTGMWREEIDHTIQPAHTALVALLCRHVGVTQADDDMHRLAFSVAGLGMMLQIGSELFETIRPDLIASPQAVDRYTERLTGYAVAMVQAEKRRR